MESERESEGEEELDSFIVDDEEEDGLFSESQSKGKEGKSKTRKKKDKNAEENRIVVDFEVWGNDKQLDMLIETLFQLLNND